MPVAVAALLGHERLELGAGIARGQAALAHGVKQGHDLARVLRLGADARHGHAHALHARQFVDQVVHAGRLRLDAVEHEELLALAGLEHQAVGVVQAAELAVVLGQVALARGKATRRKRQRHAAIGKHLGLQVLRAVLDQGGEVFVLHLQRCHPARGAQLGQPLQRGLVVNVQVQATHKRALARQALHSTHVVGLDEVIGVGRHLVHGADFHARFEQHLGGQHGLLASRAHQVGDVEPVREAQLLAARAHGFTQVDDVHRRRRHGLVEVEIGLARPVVLRRTQRELDHVRHFQGRW